MKFAAIAFCLFATVAAGAANAASADDQKWISVCMADNAGASVGPAVVEKYCACMNSKMSDNETRSITEWEKANPNARKACEATAGWK